MSHAVPGEIDGFVCLDLRTGRCGDGMKAVSCENELVGLNVPGYEAAELSGGLWSGGSDWSLGKRPRPISSRRRWRNTIALSRTWYLLTKARAKKLRQKPGFKVKTSAPIFMLITLPFRSSFGNITQECIYTSLVPFLSSHTYPST